jgi:SAM-dependent methyltransferase
MDFFDLVNISERYMEIINPSTPEKILTIGKMLGIGKDSRIIDFGCGFGEVLALWAEGFGISGIGIDIREHACDRARNKMIERGLADRIEIVCGNGRDYPFEKHGFDAALCIGASFIWGGYRQTIQAMKEAIHTNGKLVIGEPYWLKENVPQEYAKAVGTVHTEYELLRITRQEGFDFEYVVRASHDDWDRYEAGNWYGLIRWIEENSDHSERQDVIDHLHKSQEEYLRYGREYLGWAIYILTPIRY